MTSRCGDSGMDGEARSTHMKVPEAGLSQARSRLVARSVRPLRWMKMLTIELRPRRSEDPARCGGPLRHSVADLHGQSGLRRGQPGDRHAERRRADVVQTHLLEEVNR